MRIALPLQLRAFRDYLLGQYGVSSRGNLSTPASRIASDELSHLANLPAYTIQRILRFVQFPAVSLSDTNTSIATRETMETRWPIPFHIVRWPPLSRDSRRVTTDPAGSPSLAWPSAKPLASVWSRPMISSSKSTSPGYARPRIPTNRRGTPDSVGLPGMPGALDPAPRAHVQAGLTESELGTTTSNIKCCGVHVRW
jgi:hypothetical protein